MGKHGRRKVVGGGLCACDRMLCIDKVLVYKKSMCRFYFCVQS